MATELRVMIIDDIRAHRLLLRKLIELHPSLHLVAEADSAVAGIEAIQAHEPDAVFLDVQMPEKDGFGVLQSLEKKPQVVFVSAWPGFAVQAFAIEAVDYLLKPVTVDRFAATVRRLERRFSESGEPAVQRDLRDRLCLRTTESTVILPLEKIVLLEACGDFTVVKSFGQPDVYACKRLGDFDDLPNPPFVRLDRSLIINLQRVTRANWETRDTMQVAMSGLPASFELGRTAGQRLSKLLKETPL